jgi:hypothetical protein
MGPPSGPIGVVGTGPGPPEAEPASLLQAPKAPAATIATAYESNRGEIRMKTFPQRLSAKREMKEMAIVYRTPRFFGVKVWHFRADIRVCAVTYFFLSETGASRNTFPPPSDTCMTPVKTPALSLASSVPVKPPSLVFRERIAVST